MNHKHVEYGNEILVVLQGYPTNKNQLIDNIMHLKSYGLHNIVVSTYGQFLLDPKRKGVTLPANYVRLDKTNGMSPYYSDGPSSYLGKYKPDGLGIYYPGYINMNAHKSNVNLQIHSTLEGIKKGYTQEMEFEYILKCRADYTLDNTDNWISKIIKQLRNIPYNTSGIFSKKLFVHCLEDWHFDDFFMFGIKEDIFRLFNIPFKQNFMSPENYLATAYPRSQGYSSSWKTFKKNFIIDAETYNIEGVWHKKKEAGLL